MDTIHNEWQIKILLTKCYNMTKKFELHNMERNLIEMREESKNEARTAEINNLLQGVKIYLELEIDIDTIERDIRDLRLRMEKLKMDPEFAGNHEFTKKK